jgi:hypothetical protein
VIFRTQNNYGNWGASDGMLWLTEVTDSSITGTLAAKLVHTYPPGMNLPDIRVRAIFRAMMRPLQ